MTSDSTTAQCVLFPDLFGKPVVARFDQDRGSSDGGAVLLMAADRRLGLTERLASCLRDSRQAGKVRHEMLDLVRQRLFAIACGCPDANDAARLSDDPVHRLLAGKGPEDPLASQPTLSRFENAAGRKDLVRLGEALADAVIERHKRRLHGKARRITIDLDVTDDPTHGAQQLSFFNGYYDSWCYLPLLAFVSFDDEPEQHIVSAVLRPGNAPTKQGALSLLLRVVRKAAAAFPKARIMVRLDGGFAFPETFSCLEAGGIDYVIGLPGNPVLLRRTKKLMRKAARLSKESGKTERLFGERRYGARTWDRKRRVIVKAEVTRCQDREPKDNPRFVVTNIPKSPESVYETYCGRGEIENRIKELHHGLEIDRTSCSSFLANQFRILLTAGAYALMQEIRLTARGTALARAQVETIRDRLIKIGAHVVVSVRRIVLHLPRSFAFLSTWNRVALSLGARAG